MTTPEPTNDALLAAYRERISMISEIRKVQEIEGTPKHERDLLDVAAFCVARALDAWGARTGARAAWEAWIYPALNDKNAPAEVSETSEAAQ